jgi:hypothetical protein
MHASQPPIGHWASVGGRFGLAVGAVAGILLGGGVGIGIGAGLGALLGFGAGVVADRRRPYRGG